MNTQNKLSILGLGFCLLLTAGCEVDGEGDITASGDVYPSYSVNNLYSEGMDDNGNMWLALPGNYPPYGNSVVVNCDGSLVDSTLMSQSETLLEVAIPAASQYQNCNLTVFSDGSEVGTVSGGLNALLINGSSVSRDSRANYLDVTLNGDFFVQQLNQSELTVSVSCGGSGTFSPQILSSSPNSVTVAIANPGFGYQELCSFAINISVPVQGGNTLTVTSPGLTRTISGQ